VGGLFLFESNLAGYNKRLITAVAGVLRLYLSKVTFPAVGFGITDLMPSIRTPKAISCHITYRLCRRGGSGYATGTQRSGCTMGNGNAVIVVGGGPAALETARIGAGRGLHVTLVTGLPVGGRATFGSLLPSKIWLHAAEVHPGAGGTASAHAAAAPTASAHAGAADGGTAPDIPHITETIAREQQSWSEDGAARLESLGVRIVRGSARIRGAGRLTVTPESGEEHEVSADRIVLATGSEPIFYDGMRPDGERIIAPRHTQKLTALPESLTMVGGGVTGCEYALAFAKLGTEVTLLSKSEQLLPRTDPEVSQALQAELERLGMTVRTGAAAASVERTGDATVVRLQDGNTYAAEYAFIATGRGPDVEALEGAPERPDQLDGGWIRTDRHGMSSLPWLYAVGDVTGPPLTANKAHAEARRAVSHIAGQAEPDQGGPPELIEAVYTQPQVAHIGPVRELAGRHDLTVYRNDYADILLPRIHESRRGFLKLWCDPGGDEILGAAAIGEHAAELLSPVQLAMEHGLTRRQLTETPLAHPTFSELVTHVR
jgi:dihydrolipoamide dehydrogenase